MIATEVMRKALEALENSLDLVQAEYTDNWRHGLPTRAAQLDGLKRLAEDHASAITALRAEIERLEAVEPHGWLYDWVHSSATGRPDETYTGFTLNEDYAKRHDNARPIYTAPIAPATSEQKPKAGETWHVLRAGAVTCATLTISEITQSTVLFAPTSYTDKGERVPLGRGLQFIERASSPIAPAIPALTANDIDRAAGTSDGFFAGARWAYALAAERAGVQIKDPLQELADDAKQIGLEYGE